MFHGFKMYTCVSFSHLGNAIFNSDWGWTVHLATVHRLDSAQWPRRGQCGGLSTRTCGQSGGQSGGRFCCVVTTGVRMEHRWGYGGLLVWEGTCAQAERSTPKVSNEPLTGGAHGGMERPANHVCVPCSHVNWVIATHVNIRCREYPYTLITIRPPGGAGADPRSS